MKLTKYLKKEIDDAKYSVESNDVNKKPNLSDFAESVSNFNVIITTQINEESKDNINNKSVVRETWTGKFDFFFSALGYAGQQFYL